MLDVLVIGGGVVGCAVARELSRWRLRVALCEKGSDVCVGTTKANSAIVHAGHSAKPGSLMAEYNVRGNELYEQLCADLDVPFRRNGSLTLCLAAEDRPKLDELYADGMANGVPDMRIIGHDEVLRMEPNVNPEVVAALHTPTGGIVCPYELTVALAENAAMNGVEFHCEAAVEGLTSIVGGGWIVHTRKGDFRTRTVVNAAGLYADVINNMVSTTLLRITPRRGEYWMVDKAYEGAFTATLFQLPSAMGKGILVTPTVDGTILIGPTADDIDDKDDLSTTLPGLEQVLKVASQTWPGLPRRSMITSFAGLRAHLPSHDFVVGEAPGAPGFYNAAGIESPGLTAAPAIAEALCRQIVAVLKPAARADFQSKRPPVRRFRKMTDDERAAAIALDPAFGKMVCRCEMVTEAEVRDAIRRPVGARSVDGVKRRTRAGMGRCQGGFCMPRVLAILSEELGLSPLAVTKDGGASTILTARLDGVKEQSK